MSTHALNPAELYEEFYGPGIFRPLTKIFLEFVEPRRGERVLDLACGTALVARHIAPLVGAEGQVTAIDINPRMLEVARRAAAAEGVDIQFQHGDAVEVELPDGGFDLVVCQQGLQFFSDRTAALRRIHKALAPGGRVGLALWRGIERQPLLAEFAEIEARYLGPLGVSYDELARPFSLGDPDEIRELIEGAGFSRVNIQQRTVEASFPSPETFTRTMETAYGAVIPQFVEDREAFESFLDSVESDTRDVVQRYTRDGAVRFEMSTNLVKAYAG